MAYHFNVFTRSPKYFLWSSQTVFLISREQEIRRQQTIWKDKIGTLETSKNQLYLILTRKPGKIIFRHENNFFHFLMLLNFLPYFCYGSWCLYIKAPKNIITVKHNRWKKVLLYQLDLSLYFEHWIYFHHGNMYSKFEVYCCCAESRVGLAWDTHNFGRQEKCWQNVGKVLLMWQHHFVAIEELETDFREVLSFANTSTYHGLTQDTIYYKWASALWRWH